MVKLQTPEVQLGGLAADFLLENIDGRYYSLADCRGKKGLLVMFICNHCPYVKSKLRYLASDAAVLQQRDIGVVAIMPNNTQAYPEDSLENIREVSEKYGFNFPYLIDETQTVARVYGAVCTPDFFGFNSKLELQYRGRLDASLREVVDEENPRDLVNAMLEIAESGVYTKEQIPSMGCSIKWQPER
jgi:peroxiredoxin